MRKGKLLVKTRQDKISSATRGGWSKQPEHFRGGLVETRRLKPVVDTLRPVVKGAARIKFSHSPHRPHEADIALKARQDSISY